MMGENPRQSNYENRSSTRSPTNRTQVSTSSPPPVYLCTPAFQIEGQLNGVYEKRIADIEQQAGGDARLKEETYVGWIEMLRQVNKTLIVNIQEMERETSERLTLLQRKVGSNCRFSQDSDLNKYRNDVAALIQLVRNGRRNANWSVDKLHFETITESDIFGNETSYCEATVKSEPESMNAACSTDEKANFECQKAKLTANVKALAFEVAEKHDEIRDLKKQILSMEDDIQKAQKKIQLKDDVIKELRNDLKSLPKCNNLWGVRLVERTPSSSSTPRMAIRLSESDVSAIGRPDELFSNRESINCGSANALNISLPEDDDDQEELIKCLREGLSQLLGMRRNSDQNATEQAKLKNEQHDRYIDMIDKLAKRNCELRKKVTFYRQELLDLGTSQSTKTLTNLSDVDSGISSDSDADVKIINSVRGRFSCLIEETQRLIRERNNMEVKYSDANGKAEATSDLLKKTSKALREVADTLAKSMCKPIAYESIFESCQNTAENPIVEAVDDLIKSSIEKDKLINELRIQNSNMGRMSQEQREEKQRHDANKSMPARAGGSGLIRNEEFCKHLLKQAEKYQAEEEKEENQDRQNEYLRIIDDLSSELNTLSSQVNMVQKDFLTDEIARQFENSLKGLETQNDLLQSTVESLISERDTIERTMKAQNEELKRRLCAEEEKLKDLQNQLTCQVCGNNPSVDKLQSRWREEKRIDSAEELQKAEYELRRQCKTVEMLKRENVRLMEELSEIKTNQSKMKLLQRRSAIAGEKTNDEQLLSRLAAAEDENKEKTKSLQKARKEISLLQQEINNLRLAEEAYNKERELLQIELIALKETQASQAGKQKSLVAQLQWTKDELNAAKEELQETVQQLNRLDLVYREKAKHFQEQKVDMFDKYNNLVEDYNKLSNEYEKFVQIEQEKSNQLKAFTAWKEQQIQRERAIQLLEEHLKDMLENNLKLQARLNETEDTVQYLSQFIENSSRTQNGSQSVSGASGYYSACPQNDPVSKIIENARSTSRRLSQKTSVLQDEACNMFSQIK